MVLLAKNLMVSSVLHSGMPSIEALRVDVLYS